MSAYSPSTSRGYADYLQIPEAAALAGTQTIDDYAVIGDMQSAALVSSAGAIDWLCLPYFDSPACFAALLDSPDAGRWLLAPVSERPASERRKTERRYQADTLVLETRWRTATGEVMVTDFMPPRGTGGEAADVVRIVDGLSGCVKMFGELRVRFDYGRNLPRTIRRDGRVSAIAGPDAVWLTSSVPVQINSWGILSEFTIKEGQQESFVLTWSPSYRQKQESVNASTALRRTQEFWHVWTSQAKLDPNGDYAKEIKQSLIVLKALTSERTGGIVAAPTTSLPESIGGQRNWDYRYCWLRDATYSLQALIGAGYHREAQAWRDWLLRAVAGDPAELQILYALNGARRLPETDLDWLSGYAHSSPVRVGNKASDQLQLDVWGEVIDGLQLAANAGLNQDPDAWDLQVELMNYLEGRWREKDNGLWEIRGPRRHFTHSKVMAWVAADRMVRAAENGPPDGYVERWRDLRETIKMDVLARGFNSAKETFVQSYDSSDLDASLLLIPRVGFLPGDDPRVVSTVEAIQRDLTQDGLVLRYSTESGADGLPGSEGVFIACSFWLVDALHAAGRWRDAVALFERLLELRNDVGLLSEEWDPVNRRLLGNMPQAFSHFPLVVSALQLQAGRPFRSDEIIPAMPAPPE